MNVFSKLVPLADAWVKDMMAELGTNDADQGLAALRAGLHAFRDRLTVDGAAHLSAQLPLVIRGLFFEGWDPSDKPLRIRHEAEFLGLVRANYAPRADPPPQDIVGALFSVLRRHTAVGEMDKVLANLPHEVIALLTPAH